MLALREPFRVLGAMGKDMNGTSHFASEGFRLGARGGSGLNLEGVLAGHEQASIGSISGIFVLVASLEFARTRAMMSLRKKKTKKQWK